MTWLFILIEVLVGIVGFGAICQAFATSRDPKLVIDAIRQVVEKVRCSK